MPRTYSELYISVRNALRDAGVEAANVEARLIVASASGKTTAKLLQDTPRTPWRKRPRTCSAAGWRASLWRT